MQSILHFVRDHGSLFMGMGFALILGATVTMAISPDNRVGVVRWVVLTIAGIGVASYITGRVMVAMGPRMKPEDANEAGDQAGEDRSE